MASLTSSYGTRRSSALVSTLSQLSMSSGRVGTDSVLDSTQNETSAAIPIARVTPSASSPSSALSTSSSSRSKLTRKSGATTARRRLSQSNGTSLPGIHLSHSMPITSGTLSAAKLAKAAAMLEDDEDDGEVKGGTSLNRKELFECEKCNKVRFLSLVVCAQHRRSCIAVQGEK